MRSSWRPLQEAAELERVLEPVLKTADRIGEAVSVFLGKMIGRPPGAFTIRLQPDLFEMSRKAAFLLMGDLGQAIPHEVDLTPLPGCPQELLLHRGMPPFEIWQAQNPLIPPIQFLGISSQSTAVLRVLHEITGLELDPGVDGREDCDHPAPEPELFPLPLRLSHGRIRHPFYCRLKALP